MTNVYAYGVDISLISLAGISPPQTRMSGPRFFRVCLFVLYL
jgi:hypothetical protein